APLLGTVVGKRHGLNPEAAQAGRRASAQQARAEQHNWACPERASDVVKRVGRATGRRGDVLGEELVQFTLEQIYHGRSRLQRPATTARAAFPHRNRCDYISLSRAPSPFVR